MALIRKLFSGLYFIYVAAWFVVLILLAFPITACLLLLPESVKNKGMFLLMKSISNIWFVVCGIMPVNYNRKRVQHNKSYIITPNHQSYIDAAIIYTSIPMVFKTVGKADIERVPIYGLIYKTVVISVSRASTSSRASTFRKMKSTLEQGCSIAIFPEGTFSDHPVNELLPFQEGSFSLAILCEAEILPILYLDTAHRMHPARFYQLTPGLNRAVFLPPVSTAALTKQDSVMLKDYVRQYMQACLLFSRKNPIPDVWNYALTWQTQFPLKP
jgi:1-acyl-sn-glycerol-3-phosphate acyltransferase